MITPKAPQGTTRIDRQVRTQMNHMTPHVRVTEYLKIKGKKLRAYACTGDKTSCEIDLWDGNKWNRVHFKGDSEGVAQVPMIRGNVDHERSMIKNADSLIANGTKKAIEIIF